MGRVRSRPASAQPSDFAASSPTKPGTAHKRRKKNSYKVILESVTQKRKKLRLSASFSQHPPAGYTFVEFGNAKLTGLCKEFCRKRGELAFSVSAPPKNTATTDPEKISYHVNRIGFHFPNKIVDLAAEWLGIEIGGPRPRSKNGTGFTQGLSRRLRAYVNYSEQDQVRAAMRDLFPKMPEDSLEAILKHAFEEGAKRVGNAKNLTLERRVQMAVLAHVRHKHTDYDKLLKEVGYIQARKEVENPCIEKILEWRGENTDDDDDVVEMEDDFREIIVLDDSDDDDLDSEDGSGSDSSVEYVSNRPTPVGVEPRGHGDVLNPRSQPSARPRHVEPVSMHNGHKLLRDRPAFPLSAFSSEPVPPRMHQRVYIDGPPPAVVDSGRAYTRVVPREVPRLSYVHETGGRHYPETYVYRHPADRDPYMEPRIRAPRYETEVPRGQLMHPYGSGHPHAREHSRSYVIDQANHDVRFRGEPRPEDVVLPSIEKDEPAHPARTASGNDPLPYVSHQERTLMQASMREHVNIPDPRRLGADASRSSHAQQSEVIDLTSSPARPPRRNVHVGSGQPIPIRSHDSGLNQPSPAHAQVELAARDRYCDRRLVEQVGDRDTNMVGSTMPSLSFASTSPKKTENLPSMAAVEQPGHASSVESRPTDISGKAQSASRSSDDDLIVLSHKFAPTSHISDEQVHGRPLPPTRRSGDWILQPIDNLHAPNTHRRPEAPAISHDPMDAPRPLQMTRAPPVVDRIVGGSAGNEHYATSSPARMRVPRAYDDLTGGDSPVRQRFQSSMEHRSGPSQYFDYGPVNRRHGSGPKAYR